MSFKEEQLSQIEKNLLKNKNDLALKEQQLNQKAQELAKKAENLSKKEQELAKNISEIPKISNIDETLSTVSSYANIDTDNQELASIRKEDEFVLNEKSVDILDIYNGTFKDKGNRANSKQSSVVNEIDAQYAPFYYEKEVWACGLLAQIKNLSNSVLLNLDEKYPNQNLTVMIRTYDFNKLEQEYWALFIKNWQKSLCFWQNYSV